MNEEQYQKWVKWINDINHEVLVLSDYQYIFWEVQGIIKDNRKIQKPSSFYGFVSQWYTAAAVMSVRRQIKNDSDSISLARLLSEINETPEILSRKRFIDLHKFPKDKILSQFLEDKANKTFDTFSGKDMSYINPDIVKNDLGILKSKTQIIESFADRKLAHKDKRDIKKIPKFEDLDECIKLLEELVIKYMNIMLATSVSFPPTYQYDWKAIFKEPWIPKQKKKS